VVSNKKSRPARYLRRHFITLSIFAVLLAILGGLFSTSASRNEKKRAGNTTSPPAATMSLSPFAPGMDQADASLWETVDEASIIPTGNRLLIPAKYRTVRLNKDALAGLLARAPLEFTRAAQENPPIITLPMPDGSLARFSFEESPIMEQGLADKYPDLKTYRAQGIDDPTATMRFDWLPTGFHAMVLSSAGTVLVDPYASGDRTNYISYWKRDAVNTAGAFECHFIDDPAFSGLTSTDVAAPTVTSGTTLRTYRLALAATNEYTVAVGGNTIAGALAAEVLIMNRVNGVYERDLAIHMNIIANNNLITYAGDNLSCGGACTGANDPYANTNGTTMLGQNTTTLNSVIGTANYDIGHVFSTGGGGVATINGPCGGNKARGVTGLTTPIGDAFAIDYVAHEMGHQWGANHTFNSTVSNCGGGNRSAASAYEPGSGITIMAYAGICGAQDLAAHSIDTFHVRSLEAIVAYSQTGAGNVCAVPTATGNTAPSVSGPGNFTIPKGTPFSLTAAATDINGDSITYDWQEYDLGGATTAVPNTDSDGTARPIFRPYLPDVSGTRTFPSLQYILNNANVPPATTGGFLTGELLPAISRTMNFQVVARDNRANGGGINTATSTVTVDGVSGPFALTTPNSGSVGSSFNVTWNVAGTTAAPVSAANVRILLSTDSGNTFPTVLYPSTPNDGAQFVVVLNTISSTARIKVEAVGNIFFDVSDADFSIVGPTAAPATISGSVTSAEGAPLAGVMMQLSGGRSARTITDSSGNYRFANVDTGSFYTVTPSLASYQFGPENRSFSLLTNKTDAVFTASRGGFGNPLDTPEYFVRQHYLDFLGREPDQSGLDFWSQQIRACGGDSACIERRTINVSAAYFLSIEFMHTGGLVDGLYRASFGRRPLYAEFVPDARNVAPGLVVGQGDWLRQMAENKRAFVADWVGRAAFRAAYDGLNNGQFVDALIAHTGVSFGANERNALVSSLSAGATRADVLGQIVEDERFVSAKRNEMFVMMEYFGYLRRDPDENGYRFWLDKLNQFGGNFEQAEMVKAFIVSGEYRSRFGQ
jgi:hypothetical protein